MTQQVWKYEWPFDDVTMAPKAKAEFRMAEASKVLTVQMQHNRPVIWAIGHPDFGTETRTFYIVGTGHEVPIEVNRDKYVGTVQMLGGQLMLHIFEGHGP
jgi:hypothetical protein